MKWNELSPAKKTLWLLLIAVAVFVSPEFLMFLNFGGIELAASLLLINLLAIKTTLFNFLEKVKKEFEIIICVLSCSYITRKNVFFVNSVFATAVLLVTSSTLLSVGFFMAPTFFYDVASGPIL